MSEAKIQLMIEPREKDLGGFSVRRLLPLARKRMVGPFIFFDHMGPAEFQPGVGMDVRPHPHINLATVTYLFEGAIDHRDSLASVQRIEPGAINWMTAGRGIVHSERTPPDLRQTGARLNGIQLWVALPEKHEEIAPSFFHLPADQVPEWNEGEVKVRLMLGEILGRRSPVPVHSDLFYMAANIPKGQQIRLSPDGRERAVYVVQGEVQIANTKVAPFHMAVVDSEKDLIVQASEDSTVLFLGGSPVGERFIFWNFVSSSEKRLEEVKAEWRKGPRAESPRFQPIAGDDKEFIPLPKD